MKLTKVMAIDPGKTTGVAKYDLLTRTKDAEQFTDTALLLKALQAYQPDVVVMETFRPRPDKALAICGQDVYASEVIGAVKAFCESSAITVVMQQPAVKNTVRQKLLEYCGLWRITKSLPHARDAIKHLVAYVISIDPRHFTSK